MDCDILIAGGGAAGCTAACKLAEKYNVILVNAKTPATAMSTGRIQITDENDPYASELSCFLRNIGSDYNLFSNQEEITSYTNRGTPYHQSFISEHDCQEAEAVAGIKGNNDLNPELFSKVAESYGKNIKPYWLNGDLEDALQEIPEDTIIIPPLFDLKNYHQIAKLEKKCGRNLKEAATPLSMPGKRFSDCLLQAAEKSGVKILSGRELTDVSNNAALVTSGLREHLITYSTLLLAGGNVVSGGLELDGNLVREPLLNLEVFEASGRKLNSAPLSDVLSAGICSKAAKGVYACGSIVAGISYPLNKGLWNVMLNALNTADTIMEEME